MLKFGDLTFNGYAALAPMAGVADRAMREICMGFGAAYCVGELASSKGVSMGDKKSKTLLSCHMKERPMATQLFGSDPRTMADAAKAAEQFGPDFLDINMGCPAPKVISSGGGSALMRDPNRAGEVVQAVVQAVGLPVTVKMRAGWDAQTVNAVDVAKICEAAGAAAITVHGRTRAQMYAPAVDLGIIRAVKQAVSIPVIGNGDILTAQDAANMYLQTECDFVMVGRAAMGNPWIFSQINALLGQERVLPEPTLHEKLSVLLRQIEAMQQYKDPHNAILESRKHAAWYMRGLNGAAALRRACSSISCMEDVYKLVHLALEMNPQNK